MDFRDYVRKVAAETTLKEEPVVSAEERIFDSAATYLNQSMRMHAASVVQAWAETDEADLDVGETLSDRLFALLMAIVDKDEEDDLTDDEQDMLEAVLIAAEEYMLSLGVPDDDVSALMDAWDDAAALRVRDVIASSLPDGDGADDDLARFAFDEESTASIFDSVYKKVVAYEHGQKTIKRKRVSGPPPKMSPKQRAQLRMARMKSHKGAANLARKMSVKKRINSGIGMKRKLA